MARGVRLREAAFAAERFFADDAELTRSRMALLAATRQVLRNALGMIGVSAPDSM